MGSSNLGKCIYSAPPFINLLVGIADKYLLRFLPREDLYHCWIEVLSFID